MKPLLFRDLAPRNIPIPPVTGLNSNNLPYANVFDETRTFRDRTYSNKRRRRDGQDELLDAVYDLTNDFPPVAPPDRPVVDVAAIKTALVEATKMTEIIKPLLARDELSEESKAVYSMLVTLVDLVGAVVEKGIEPISAAVVGGNTNSRGFVNAARKLANPPPVLPKTVPGKKELVEALKRSETESVLFGADLGTAGIAHRGTLNANFTAGLRRQVVKHAEGKPSSVLDESLRVVEDALSCVDSLDFLGQRSQPYKPPGGGETQEFCSIPIRLSFLDKDTRMNFERTVRSYTGLRVSQSLPPVLRSQMAAFRKALEGKYGGDMIMVSPETACLEFIAFREGGGGGKWEQLPETYPIPPQSMLPGFKAPDVYVLPASVVVTEEGHGGGDMKVG